MPKKNHLFLQFCFLFFFASKSKAVTLTAAQTDYTTTSDITIASSGISSSFSGSAASLNKIKNLHIITTGNFGATSGAYGIKSGGNYNQITNAADAAIFTSGNSGRGISIVNNSIVLNAGSISTQGTTSYGIYAGGNANNVTNSGSISTINTTSYGIYLNGDNNFATSSGSITTKVYGIYGNGNVNQISNSGDILTTSSSSAHGIYVSAGSSSTASAASYSTINNSGTINSSGHGIYAKDNYTLIANSGTISTAATASIYGIRNDGNNSIITNSGDINSTNYAIYNSGASVTINSSGDLFGGIYVGDGVLNIEGGSISGNVEGGDGVSNVNVGSSSHSTINFSQTSAFNNLNDLTINFSSALNSSSNISANRILIGAGSALNLLGGSSSSASIQGLSDGVGSLNIVGFSFETDSEIGISGKALANLNIASNASARASKDIYVSNIFINGSLNFSGADNLTIFGNVAGGGLGTIDVGSKNQIISGNFLLNSGDALAVTLKKDGVGSLVVAGLANIDVGSKLKISTSSNQGYIASGTQYSLVGAGLGSVINKITDENISVNGGNSNIDGLLKFTTTAAEDGLNLNIERLPAAQVTTNKNSQNIYQNLSDLGNSGRGKLLEFQEYLDNSGLSGEEITKALNQLAPQSTKAQLAAVNNIVGASMAILENRLEKIKRGEFKNSFWSQAFGGSAEQMQVAHDDGYKTNSAGLAFGLDKETSNEVLIGAALSFARSNAKTLDQSKQNLIDTFQFNIYGGKNFDEYFFDIVAAAALNNFNSSRSIAAVKSNANARYFGETYALKMKSGWVKKIQNGFSITPEIGLNFFSNNISKYRESGASELNLDVAAISANFLEGRAGLNFGYLGKIHNSFEFKKFAALFKISYGHAFVNDAPTTSARFSGQNKSFDSQISYLDTNSLKLGGELAAYHKDDVTFSFDYNFEHKKTANSHFVLAKIRQDF